MGLALVAVFAFIALAASAAQAQTPEWGLCVAQKKPKAHYEDASCTKEDFKESSKGEKKYKGKYEWLPGAKVDCVEQKKGHYKDSACTEEDFKENSKGEKKYSGKYEKTAEPKFKGSGGSSVLYANPAFCIHGDSQDNEFCREVNEQEGRPANAEYWHQFVGDGFPDRVECTSENAEGELSGTKEATNVHVVFHGCKYNNRVTCQNTQAVEGEIKVNPLAGELGYLSKANKEVGVVLHPIAADGVFAEFECGHGFLYFQVGGSPSKWTNRFGTTTLEPFWSGSGHGVISPVTPVDKMSSTFTQAYKVVEPEEASPEPGSSNTIPQNVPSRFEGGPVEQLETLVGSAETSFLVPEEEISAYSPSGEEVTNVNTGLGEIEIKA